MVHLQRAVEMSEKILVFHRQPYYRYYTIYRECYDIRRNVRIVVFFFSIWSFASNFVCFREIFSGLDIDESYNYIQRVINLEYSDYLFAG